MDSGQLPSLPLEIQQDIFEHLCLTNLSSLSTACCLSRTHNRLLTPLLYRYIYIRSRSSLECLAATLLEKPEKCLLIRSFFFQGPQGRRRTGREALQSIHDCLVDEEDVESLHEQHYHSGSGHFEEDELKEVGLEAGIEGEGQEATWDEHESLMYLCTLVLKLCSSHLLSIGFVDCVPWFLAPTEGGVLNFPLPKCKDFTGVTVGLFGLLPHLQRGKQITELEGDHTALSRIHLIGGDFGSFALQRVLIYSPSAASLTHLHITAPTLYRPEHHLHLVTHIASLLNSIPNLKRISVGFLHWTPAPAPKRSTHKRIVSEDMDLPIYEDKQMGTGDDSFERYQFKQKDQEMTTVSAEDDRLLQCRQAYIRALPEALQQSKRRDVTVSIVKLPFVEGGPTGFAGWILSHHFPGNRSRLGNVSNRETLQSWKRRNLSALPDSVAEDGAPRGNIWQIEANVEWKFDGKRVEIVKEDEGNSW